MPWRTGSNMPRSSSVLNTVQAWNTKPREHVGRSTMQLEDMYQEIILDHYRNPHHKGLRDPFDAEVYQVNPTCGDEVTLRVSLKRVSPQDTGGGEAVVEDVSFESLGC